jgi:F-type H+-transporting ATPase subunit b
MNSKTLKKTLPLLLAAFLYAGTMTGTSLAVEHGEEHQAVHTTMEQQTAKQTGNHTAAGGHGEAAGHEEGGHHAPMITGAKLWDLLWRTLNFAALVFLLVKFGGKPVASFLGNRRRTIAEDLKEMQTRRDEAEQACQEFEQRLAGMEEEIALTVERAVSLAAKEKERILAEAAHAAQEIKRQAEAAVQAAMDTAQRGLQEEVAEQATAMAEQLIVKQLTPADHVAIIEQYLERTGKAQ